MARIMSGLVIVALLVAALPGSVLAQDGDPVGIAQAVVDNMLSGDFEAATADFDATMLAALPAEILAQTWDSLIGQVGAFEQQLGATSSVNGAMTTVVMPMQFEHLVLDFQITVNDAGQVAGFYIQQHQEQTAPAVEYTAPAYADPAAFEEQDIVLNAGTEWELPGTLTIPEGDGPFPAVVLVHGSGPSDRDEAYGPQKVFADLAWGLASQGIAVLRYDKRTYVHGSAMAASQESLTVQEETIDDARAAVALLQGTEGIDPTRIVVLGHSMGGYLAPRIAAQGEGIAGLVLMAGNSRPLEDLTVEQVSYLLGLDGEITADDQAQIDAVQASAEAIKTVQSPDDASLDELMGVPAPYWIDLQSYDPLAVAQSLSLPMLVLQGERDYQVTMVDFQGWQDALAGRENVTYVAYPALDHHFVAGEGLSTPDDYNHPGNVDEAVIIDIAHWVLTLE